MEQLSTVKVEYLSVVETAKELRKRLKAAHPGTKFSVRSDSYAGGASIRVSWTDGPTRREVEATREPLVGSDFDGMQDLKTYRDPIGINGRYVRSGADHIFCDRELSAERTAELEQLAADYLGIESIDKAADYFIPGIPNRGGLQGYYVAREIAEHPEAEAELRAHVAARNASA
jgi:hypothetical protein